MIEGEITKVATHWRVPKSAVTIDWFYVCVYSFTYLLIHSCIHAYFDISDFTTKKGSCGHPTHCAYASHLGSRTFTHSKRSINTRLPDWWAVQGGQGGPETLVYSHLAMNCQASSCFQPLLAPLHPALSFSASLSSLPKWDKQFGDKTNVFSLIAYLSPMTKYALLLLLRGKQVNI